MRFRIRPRINLGVIRFNFSGARFTSWSLHPLPRLSWNSRTRQVRWDSPGPGWVELWKTRKRRRQ